MFLSETLWGFQPQAPAYFSLAGKVGKRAHRGGTLSMGSLPYVPLPRDDTKGGSPPFGIPHQPSACPHFLRILPKVRYKKQTSASTNRNIYLFNRAGGRSIVDRPAVDRMTKT